MEATDDELYLVFGEVPGKEWRHKIPLFLPQTADHVRDVVNLWILAFQLYYSQNGKQEKGVLNLENIYRFPISRYVTPTEILSWFDEGDTRSLRIFIDYLTAYEEPAWKRFVESSKTYWWLIPGFRTLVFRFLSFFLTPHPVLLLERAWHAHDSDRENFYLSGDKQKQNVYAFMKEVLVECMWDEDRRIKLSLLEGYINLAGLPLPKQPKLWNVSVKVTHGITKKDDSLLQKLWECFQISRWKALLLPTAFAYCNHDFLFHNLAKLKSSLSKREPQKIGDDSFNKTGFRIFKRIIRNTLRESERIEQEWKSKSNDSDVTDNAWRDVTKTFSTHLNTQFEKVVTVPYRKVLDGLRTNEHLLRLETNGSLFPEGSLDPSLIETSPAEISLTPPLRVDIFKTLSLLRERLAIFTRGWGLVQVTSFSSYVAEASFTSSPLYSDRKSRIFDVVVAEGGWVYLIFISPPSISILPFNYNSSSSEDWKNATYTLKKRLSEVTHIKESSIQVVEQLDVPSSLSPPLLPRHILLVWMIEMLMKGVTLMFFREGFCIPFFPTLSVYLRFEYQVGVQAL